MSEFDKITEHPPVTRADLAAAYWDNVRHNQIGGQTDGIGQDVAADLGFETPEDVTELYENLPEAQRQAVDTIGDVICGECAQVIPCAHAGVDGRGRGFTRGN